MDREQLIILWTARLAIGVMLFRVWLAFARGRRPPTRLECMIWTAGCLLYLLHVLAAFHWTHDWSHDAAWRHVAEQTEDVTGRRWGGGLYLNYAFTVAWLADVAWVWRDHRRGIRSTSRTRPLLHAFLGLMVINATVVFGSAGWWAAAVLFACGLLLIHRGRRRHDCRTRGDVSSSPRTRR